MKKIMCLACGGETKRNGRTGSGRARWRCKSCGASATQRYDDAAKLQAGAELYGIAKDLLHVADQDGAARWLLSVNGWCARWDGFLRERTVIDGKRRYKHGRLRKARRSLERPCRDGTLFTFLEDDLAAGGPVPATSNKIESSNARIREVLRNHRGMPIDRRIKAGFWWCCMNSEAPCPTAGWRRRSLATS